ncbi:MAG: radical SAM protein [Candidatus Margulisbacteria bacterium]|nr:radical SAM protein [Candidatus Margulisiibacteriota bacterium]
MFRKKIKLALLIDEFWGAAGTAYGGFGFLARNYIAKYLPDETLAIDVLLGMSEDLKEFHCEEIDRVRLYKFPANKTLVKEWLKKQNYTIFLSIELTYPSAELFELIDNKKLILWVQDPRPESVVENSLNTMKKIKDPCVYNARSARLVSKLYQEKRVKFITQGESLTALAKELYRLPPHTKIPLLTNPIELDLTYNFNPAAKQNKIIFLGRLEAQKRAWLFCETARRLPAYDFYVIGQLFREKEENQDILNPYLNADIPNLHFMGLLEGEAKAVLIKEAKILLNTSIWEAIPVSWLECLQYGTLPVSCLDRENLVSRFGYFTGEVLGDGLDGIEKFTAALTRILNNYELYIPKALAGIDYVRKNHNVAAFRPKLLAVINKELRPDLAFGLRQIPKKIAPGLKKLKLFYLDKRCRKLAREPGIYHKLKKANLIRPTVCYAAATTLNFDTMGRITACCFNRGYILGSYPDTSIKAAWLGPERKKLLNALNKYDFRLGCGYCQEKILHNQYCEISQEPWDLVNNNGWPSKMEFEFSPVCNLECIMCGGKWSSAIRKNREKLPPLNPPLDDAFLEQLEEFIPHLKYAAFLGGEPFLAPAYYKIWQKIAKLNKNLSVHITSNCSIYNKKVQEVLDLLPNLRITASLDSLQKATYESIRRGACFETVLAHVNIFIKKHRLSSLSVCPLIQNIYEIPDLVRFCEVHKIDLYFNHVTGALSGNIKYIHAGGSQTTTWNGISGEPLPPEALAEAARHAPLPEFRLSTLSDAELAKIKLLLDKTAADCTRDDLKEKIRGLKTFLRQ